MTTSEMTPELLCELLAAWIFELMYRQATRIAEGGVGLHPSTELIHAEYIKLMPAWHNMMSDLELPLLAPEDGREEVIQVKVEELALYMRQRAQELAGLDTLEAELPDASGPMN